MTNTIETTIVNALKTHGWFVRHGAAIATKIFDTCVGEKEAFVYLLNLRNTFIFILAGEYVSQGRNILSTNNVTIPKNSDPQEIYKLTSQFANNIEITVADSYAVRLLKLGVKP